MHLLRIWWSSARRRPLIFFLKTAGFAVSFAVCALILAFIDAELHYDAWNPNADRIARGVETRDVGRDVRFTSLPYAFADAAKADLPGVEAAARVQPVRAPLVRGRDRFNETLFFVDPSFLKIFPVSIVAGNGAGLAQPNSLVISERGARKYFGTDNAIGKVLRLGDQRDVTVTAVMKDWPADSHMRPDFLLSLDTFFSIATEAGASRASITGWSNCHCYATYLLFDSPAAMSQARRDVSSLLVARRGTEYAHRFPIALQPLRDIYLHSGTYVSYLDYAAKGDPTELTVFGAMAGLLLATAGLSFANFSSAEAAARARAFAMRRLLGGRRRGIAASLILEGAATAILAAFAGLGLAAAAVNAFGRFVDRPFSETALVHGWRAPALLAIALAGGALAGLAPGFVMARIPPLTLLRGSLGRNMTAPRLRSGLIATQFVASFVLVVFALAIRGELGFVQAQVQLGFDADHLLVVNAEGSENVHTELTRRILALPGVVSVATANSVPTTPVVARATIACEDATATAGRAVFVNDIDFHYLKALGIRLVAGRGFDPSRGADSVELGRYRESSPSDNQKHALVDVIVNAAAAKSLGFDSPSSALASQLRFTDGSYPFTMRIVGVTDNVHYAGPREPVGPMLYLPRSDWGVNLHAQSYLAIRTQGNDEGVAAKIAGIWDELVPGFAPGIEHMNDRVARQTANERRELGLLSGFTGAALLLAVLGLLGFAALTMSRQARSLAVRRVFGATRSHIALLVSSAHLSLVAISLPVACPIAWLLVSRWIRGFVVQTPLDVWWFVAGALLIVGVSFGALAVYAYRISGARPVEYLRGE